MWLSSGTSSTVGCCCSCWTCPPQSPGSSSSSCASSWTSTILSCPTDLVPSWPTRWTCRRPGGSEEPRPSDGHPCVCADRTQHGTADPAAPRDVRQRPAGLLDVSYTAEPYCYRNTLLTVRPEHAGCGSHEAEEQGVSALLA